MLGGTKKLEVLFPSIAFLSSKRENHLPSSISISSNLKLFDSASAIHPIIKENGKAQGWLE